MDLHAARGSEQRASCGNMTVTGRASPSWVIVESQTSRIRHMPRGFRRLAVGLQLPDGARQGPDARGGPANDGRRDPARHERVAGDAGTGPRHRLRRESKGLSPITNTCTAEVGRSPHGRMTDCAGLPGGRLRPTFGWTTPRAASSAASGAARPRPAWSTTTP
jgi:hypothetical protein